VTHEPTKKPWFKTKSYGYGPGFPISWEGWLAVAVYVGVIRGLVYLMQRDIVPRTPLATAGVLLVLLALTGLLAWIAHSRTEGGWRWRWGDQDKG
jgi:hypothetical protein